MAIDRFFFRISTRSSGTQKNGNNKADEGNPVYLVAKANKGLPFINMPKEGCCTQVKGSNITAQTDDDNRGTACHVIDTLSLQLDLNFRDLATGKIISYNKEIRLPEGEALPGICSPTKQDLYYFTPDGFMEINMKFHLREDEDIEYWGLDDLAILILEQNVTTDAGGADLYSKRDRKLPKDHMMFRAPINVTYQCTRISSAIYPSSIHSAMIFSQVQLQPYSEYVQFSSEKGYICPRRKPKSETSGHGSGELLVPIILATSLGIVVLLLLIGYLVLRRIGKLGYQNME